MPATPTTKSQVHAYKFVLRRMESALVRRDAVMLHEPMRGHSRATIVGVIVAAALCLGFVLASVLAPAGSINDQPGIVVSKSGAVFVIGQNPKRLIPVPNITSARLLLMSTQNGGGSGGNSVAPVSSVDDSALSTVPHDVMYGMPNAPTMLPDPSNQVSPDWAVCDQANVPSDIQDPTAQFVKTTLGTTVLAGIPSVGSVFDPKKTMLVTPDAATFYLIYTAQNPAGLGGNSVVRAAVNPKGPGIPDAFQLQSDNGKIRKISLGLLNSIPEVPEMKAPTVPNAGTSPSYDLDGMTVGQVFKTDVTSTHFYVVLQKGVQEIPPVLASLLRIEYGHGNTRSVQPSELANINQALNTADKLDLSNYPATDVSPPVGFDEAKASCLTWQYNTATKKATTKFTLSDKVPAPTGTNTRLVQADQGTGNVQFFYMPGGKAAVVRSITSSQSIADDGTITGPLYLVSDTGVKYGLPSTQIAQGLGLGTDYKPAPEAIMKLLPTGASLDPASATRVFDTIPIDSTNQDHRPVSPSQGNQASSGG